MRAESARRNLPVIPRRQDMQTSSLTHRELLSDLQRLRREMKKIEAELDATRVKEANARHLATHDMLTGIPNQRYFRGRLEQLLHPGPLPPPVLALLYIDLNGFKAINDTLGHAMGDQLLRAAAQRLKHAIRKDDIICRLGGDEFGCLLVGIEDRRQIVRVATKAVRALGAPLRLGKLQCPISASIGIARSPTDHATPEGLMQRADTAMYFAKKQRIAYAFCSDVRATLAKQT